MVDMAHFAGLVAGGVHPSPVPARPHRHHHHAQDPPRPARRHGPLPAGVRRRVVDRSVFPGQQGGPLMHIVAAKAVAFKEALQPEFAAYAQQIVANAKVLAEALAADWLPHHLRRHRHAPHAGRRLPEGNPRFRGRVRSRRRRHHRQQERHPLRHQPSPQAQRHPHRDPRAHHTRHEGSRDERSSPGWIAQALEKRNDPAALAKIRGEVGELAEKFPLYGWLRQ